MEKRNFNQLVYIMEDVKMGTSFSYRFIFDSLKCHLIAFVRNGRKALEAFLPTDPFTLPAGYGLESLRMELLLWQ